MKSGKSGKSGVLKNIFSVRLWQILHLHSKNIAAQIHGTLAQIATPGANFLVTLTQAEITFPPMSENATGKANAAITESRNR